MGNIIDINELKNHEFEQFISKATNKTPSGILHVYDWSEKAWIEETEEQRVRKASGL
jgi:hypothetical protein